MDRSFVIVRRFTGQQDAASVLAVLEPRMALLGGAVIRQAGGFSVQGGRANVDLAFMAEIDAVISARDAGPGAVDVTCQIRLTPNAVFWICLILGFCTVVAWAVPVLFFVCDPRRAYDQIIITALPGSVAGTLPGFGS